jgi:hypothetical protein
MAYEKKQTTTTPSGRCPPLHRRQSWVVAIDIKSIISKRGEEEDENIPRFFEVGGGRHDRWTKGRFINDMFVSGLDEYTSSLNDPQWVFLSGAYYLQSPPPPEVARLLVTLLV